MLNPDCLWQIFRSLSLSDVLSCCLAAPNYFNDAAQIFFARNVKELKIHQKQPPLRGVRRKLTSFQTAIFLLRLTGAHVTNLTVLYEGFNAVETNLIAVAVHCYCKKLVTFETDAKSKPILPDLQALQSIIIRNSLYWNEYGKMCDLLPEYLSKCNNQNLNSITWFDSTKYQKLPGYFETVEIQYHTRPNNSRRLAEFSRLYNLTTVPASRRAY